MTEYLCREDVLRIAQHGNRVVLREIEALPPVSFLAGENVVESQCLKDMENLVKCLQDFLGKVRVK